MTNPSPRRANRRALLGRLAAFAAMVTGVTVAPAIAEAAPAKRAAEVTVKVDASLVGSAMENAHDLGYAKGFAAGLDAGEAETFRHNHGRPAYVAVGSARYDFASRNIDHTHSLT